MCSRPDEGLTPRYPVIESTGEEEAKNGEDADDGDIPAVGLSKSDADTGNGAALVRTVEWTAGHGVSDRQDRAAV